MPDTSTEPMFSQHRSPFALLVNARSKRMLEIGKEHAHTVTTEKNRLQLFREVQLFLEER
ncbi:MAG: hypothetical protein C5B46_07025 [Proteobacteria bacterium]|nr:MAG: hypothetical protein C5B46_07025 [Pseudomonadota bacterium]